MKEINPWLFPFFWWLYNCIFSLNQWIIKRLNPVGLTPRLSIIIPIFQTVLWINFLNNPQLLSSKIRIERVIAQFIHSLSSYSIAGKGQKQVSGYFSEPLSRKWSPVLHFVAMSFTIHICTFSHKRQVHLSASWLWTWPCDLIWPMGCQ